MDKYIEIIEKDEVLNLIKPYIDDKEAYIVGGFVRDVFMNKKSPDRDLIICNCDVKDFSKKLADELNAHFIELDNENEIYRIVLKDKINYLDITKPIENDFEKDIKRRFALKIFNSAFCLPDRIRRSQKRRRYGRTFPRLYGRRL